MELQPDLFLSVSFYCLVAVVYYIIYIFGVTNRLRTTPNYFVPVRFYFVVCYRIFVVVVLKKVLIIKHTNKTSLIDEYLRSNDCKLQFYYIDITIDLGNYEEPIKPVLNSIFIQLNPTLFIKRNYHNIIT